MSSPKNDPKHDLLISKILADVVSQHFSLKSSDYNIVKYKTSFNYKNIYSYLMSFYILKFCLEKKCKCKKGHGGHERGGNININLNSSQRNLNLGF